MSPSEQMYFQGAPLAHVVLYYEVRKVERIEKSIRGVATRERRFAARILAPLQLKT
jgi:hypothetical protein